MTWSLLIGSWVAVALVAGLLVAAMIRRAEVQDLVTEEPVAEPSTPGTTTREKTEAR